MTMRDQIAALLWRTEAVDSGTPQSLIDRRTPEVFADQSPELRGKWFKYADAILAALPGMGPGWQPIETAPKGVARSGKLGICWMMLAWPDEDGEFNTASGMRVGEMFFAGCIFYAGGPFDGKQYSIREAQVIPTHWMPLPAPPVASDKGDA